MLVLRRSLYFMNSPPSAGTDLLTADWGHSFADLRQHDVIQIVNANPVPDLVASVHCFFCETLLTRLQ